MNLEQKKLVIPFRVLSTCRFHPSKMFCRISPKCKFLLWAIELDIFKVILYSNNELYLLLPTPQALSKGHSNSLRKRFCEISRAFGWWWGHVSHPYLRSQSRSSDWDIKVTIKIVEIVAMAPSGIEHVFSSLYAIISPSFFFLSPCSPSLPYLSSYHTSSFCLAIVLMCFQVLLRPLAPHLTPTHPLSPSFLVVFLSFVVATKIKSPKFVSNSKSTINVRKNINLERKERNFVILGLCWERYL